MNNKKQITKFELGNTYMYEYVSSDRLTFFQVVRKTEKSMWIKFLTGHNSDKVARCKIHIDDRYESDIEFIYPEGKHSLCPVVDANDYEK